MAGKMMVLAELQDAQCKQSLTQLLRKIRMMESMNKESSYMKLIIVGFGHCRRQHHDRDRDS